MKKFLLLALVLTACTPPSSPPKSQSQSQSVITPDWSIAGTLTAIGLPPVATGDVKTYPDWSLEPALPSNTIDLGSRFNMNPELTHQLSADLVVYSGFYSHLTSMYGELPSYHYQGVADKEVRTWQDYADATMTLAKAVNKEPQAQAYLERSKGELAKLGQTFGQQYPNIKRLAVVQFASSQQIRSYTSNSPFAPALEQMGLQLYTFGKGNAWGSLDIGLANLTKIESDTCLVIIEPFSPMLQRELASNALWRQLGFGSSRCMMVLKPIWAFGDVPSMMGFASAITNTKGEKR